MGCVVEVGNEVGPETTQALLCARERGSWTIQNHPKRSIRPGMGKSQKGALKGRHHGEKVEVGSFLSRKRCSSVHEIESSEANFVSSVELRQMFLRGCAWI